MASRHAAAKRRPTGPGANWHLGDLLRDPARDLECLRKEVDGQVRRFEEFR